MRGATFALALLLSGLAHAEEDFGVIPPPSKWEYAPLTLPILVREVHPFDLQNLCPQFIQPGERVDACTVIDGGTCFIFMRNDGIDADMFFLLLRHEYAHCKGWGDDHPLD